VCCSTTLELFVSGVGARFVEVDRGAQTEPVHPQHQRYEGTSVYWLDSRLGLIKVQYELTRVEQELGVPFLLSIQFLWPLVQMNVTYV